jgi:hypothetical protein
MKKATIVLLTIAVVLPWPMSIFAGNTPSFVIVTAIDQRNDGKFILDLSSPIQNSACATVLDRVTGDATTSAGKAMLQVSMSALLSGKRVYVETNNTCSEYAGIDSMSRIYVSSN